MLGPAEQLRVAGSGVRQVRKLDGEEGPKMKGGWQPQVGSCVGPGKARSLGNHGVGRTPGLWSRSPQDTGPGWDYSQRL